MRIPGSVYPEQNERELIPCQCIRWRLVCVGQITNMVGGQWGRMTPGVIKDEQ
jgi:hypothetical protein